MPLQTMGKFLIFTGIIIIIFGLILIFAPKIPYLGRLPGDIIIQRKNFTFYFPLVTCIILSLVLTIILNLIFRK
ncbi:MAG: DUF2905 domain-containing protein [Candidatus Desulfofervidus auxilii]|nr:DUF2905 domain-containing protein [Candidatus Desulfofervidus auxilii]